MIPRPFGYVRGASATSTRTRTGPDAAWLVALFVIATFSTLVVGGVLLSRRGDRTMEYRTTARFDLRSLHPVAEKYAADHPGVCPSIAALVREKEISAATTTSDPWQTPYRIECRPAAPDAGGALTVVVRSAGPDRQFGTKDDLSLSSPE